MKLSLNWLKDFVDIGISANDLAELISAKLTEVEKVTDQAKKYEGIVCARVEELTKHPNSDHLWLVKVFDGVGERKIVCGAQNLAVGQIVPLIMPGTIVPATSEILKEAVIRGEKSEGMLCSGRELGLSNDHDGIHILNKGLKPGTPLSVALGLNDTIIEIENKALTHRGDCFSHIGIAREISAITDQELKLPNYNLPQIGSEQSERSTISQLPNSDVKLDIKIENDKNCPRYMAAYVTNIKIGPSPDYIQKRLQNCGVRPINNIVDFTNYVMLQTGQPLHAFDAAKLKKTGQTFNLGVRRTKASESITTLDGNVHKLTSDNLVITNNDVPVAAAGVMGGASSEISETTKEIIIEAANFDHFAIRRSSRVLGLRTEASMRYEKNLDPNLAELGMSEILKLISNSGVGDIKIIADEYQSPVKEKVIEISEEFVVARLGVKIELKEAVAILNRLGLTTLRKRGPIQVTIPTWRRDINIPEDLIEEIARVYGYEKIAPQLSTRDLTPVRLTTSQESKRQLLKLLSQLGYSEVYSYSFVGNKAGEQLEIVNPLSPELKYIRNDLKPGLLEKVEYNSHYFDHLKIFELGKEIIPTSATTLPNEVTKLVAAYYDKTSTDPETLFRQAKGDMELILAKFNVTENDGIATIKPYNHQTIIFEINVQKLINVSATHHQEVLEVPKFPPIIEDISFYVNNDKPVGNIIDAVKKTSPLISSVEVFDVYKDESRRSVAIRLTYQDATKPLSNQHVSPIRQAIITKLTKLGVEVRIKN